MKKIMFMVILLSSCIVFYAKFCPASELTDKCDECWPNTTYPCIVGNNVADSKADKTDLRCNLRMAIWCANNTNDHCRKDHNDVQWKRIYIAKGGDVKLDRRILFTNSLDGKTRQPILRDILISGLGDVRAKISPSTSYTTNCTPNVCKNVGFEINKDYVSNVQISNVEFTGFPDEAIWIEQPDEPALANIAGVHIVNVKFTKNGKEDTPAILSMTNAKRGVLIENTEFDGKRSPSIPAILVGEKSIFQIAGTTSFRNFDKSEDVISFNTGYTQAESPEVIGTTIDDTHVTVDLLVKTGKTSTLPTCEATSKKKDRLALYRYVESGNLASYLPLSGINITKENDKCNDLRFNTISIASSDYVKKCQSQPKTSSGQICVQIKLDKSKLAETGLTDIQNDKVSWLLKWEDLSKNSGFSAPKTLFPATPDTPCTDPTNMTDECICKSEFDGIDNSGKCISCISPKTYDSILKTCKCTDPDKMTESCSCKEAKSTINDEGKCVSKCKEGEEWSQEESKCKTIVAECSGPYEELNPDGTCGCGDPNTAYRDLSGQCVSVATPCPTNATCNTGVAVCDECYEIRLGLSNDESPSCVRKNLCTPNINPGIYPSGGCSLIY